jgi:hypothetical protein
MSNVILLFRQKTIENHPSDEFNNSVTIAIANILTVSAELDSAVKELSVHFDAADKIIDALDDVGIRNQHSLLVTLGRKTLINATFELSQVIKSLPTTIGPRSKMLNSSVAVDQVPDKYQINGPAA